MTRICEPRPHILWNCAVLKGMNTTYRRALLVALVLLALFVGGWAAAAPTGFYASFPGFGLHWVSSDGPYNEHLVRDVGDLYLGLGAASIAAIFSRSANPARMIGLGWTVFNGLHLGYHLLHLGGSVFNRVGNTVSLSFVLALAVLLMLPPRRRGRFVPGPGPAASDGVAQ